MKYDRHGEFRHILIGVLRKAEIIQSPIREKFISLSWQLYNSPKDGLKLFANHNLEKSRYYDIIRKLKKKRMWGSYLFIISDGKTTRLL